MFTGIVEGTAKVREIKKGRLFLEMPSDFKNLEVGQSISIQGCCLTVVQKEGSLFTFDLSPETLARTQLGDLHVGDSVNFERGLKLGAPLDGHWVTGHIDTTANVRSIQNLDGESRSVWFTVPRDQMRWVVEKGSITIDGVSLTVNEIDATGFSVVLIPHTWKITSLSRFAPSTKVNIEFDVLAKYVERIMGFQKYTSIGAVA